MERHKPTICQGGVRHRLCYAYSGSNYVSCHYTQFNPLHCTAVIDSWHQSVSEEERK